MKHSRAIAASLLIALAGMMFVSTASSQISIRAGPEHRYRHHFVHHPRSQVRVRVNVAEHRRVVRHDVERHREYHPEERHETR